MESPDIIRFIVALIFVVSLMALLWIILKKLGLSGGVSAIHGKKRRLKIVEILPIDLRHKAVLLRCDDKDHLVILGPNGETVVEQSMPIKDELRNDV